MQKPASKQPKTSLPKFVAQALLHVVTMTTIGFRRYKTAEEKATRFAIFVENRIYVHRANMEKDQTATFESKFELTLS